MFRFSCLPVKAHGFVMEYPGQAAHFIHEAVTGSVTVTGFSGKQIAVPDLSLIHILFLDFSEQTASLNGKPLTLSPMEYKMLNLFRKKPRQVLTRGQLLEKLWDIDERFVDEHTLTTSISRIRSKIESDGGRCV